MKPATYNKKTYRWREDVQPPVFGYTAEHQQLEKAIVYIYKRNVFKDIDDPDDYHILEKPNYRKLNNELKCLSKKLQSLGVDVISPDYDNPTPNIVFQRDLFIPHNTSIIIGSPSSEIRYPEAFSVLKWFYNHNYPVKTLTGYLETSDIIKRENDIYIGIKNRSNIFPAFDPNLTPHIVDIPSGVQHLLGIFNPISKDKVAIREQYYKPRYHNLNYIKLRESDEVKNKQAMNFLTIKSNEILMPDDCPDTKSVYESYGIKVHTTPINELRKLAGGIACTVGILKRKY